ncbi:hypothetical protein ABZT47_21045 [Sphaerisporangium sp. NPDC005289]|uniref:hypothetical protein n=1 Tax=Sphaerisporangium sp. NPDC005289 TaxID=3155247 RepID=UPI0033B24245
MSFDRHLAEIAREFPDWTIWRSDAGRWWATRHHLLTEHERDAGGAMTIDADDPAGLRERLLEQRRLIPGLDQRSGLTGEAGPTRASTGQGGTGEPGASPAWGSGPPGAPGEGDPGTAAGAADQES